MLLVEDNAADIGLVREALEEYQVRCELVVAINGEKAIKLIDEIEAGQQPCPDLIIVDLNLPRKSGKDVLQRARAGRVCNQVPLVVLTSSNNQRDRDDVAPLNPSGYLRKPSKLDEFIKLGAIFKQLLYPSGDSKS